MKRILLLATALILPYILLSQVGIGTTSPNTSAALEIASTTQGMLAPRMAAAQRIAIETPATGLLVYDTDDDLFYYFNGGSWVPIGASEKRDNYKLVKSAADLADELTAGGGSEYLLNENFLYEINGTIALSNPINLNGAYLIGQDTNEDVLFYNGTGALFQTTAGGSIRNLLINTGGSDVFDITGTGTQSIVVNNTIFAGSSGMGLLSNLNVVFFNICQFVNNADGFEVTNITSFLMNNIFWNTSNSGTFLALNGTFDDVQIANGRVVADTGETGLDLTNNPVINISGSLNGVNFAGSGTRVDGYTTNSYTGYNFTNIWDVNCPGIPIETDETATGDINLSAVVGSGVTTSFTGTGTTSRRKVQGTTTSNNLFRFIKVDNNRIQYKGLRTRYFKVSASISFQSSANNTIYIFYLAKGSGTGNATVLEETKVYRQSGGTGDIGALSVLGTVELSPDDYIEVWAERYSGSGSVLTVSLNLVAN